MLVIMIWIITHYSCLLIKKYHAEIATKKKFSKRISPSFWLVICKYSLYIYNILTRLDNTVQLLTLPKLVSIHISLGTIIRVWRIGKLYSLIMLMTSPPFDAVRCSGNINLIRFIQMVWMSGMLFWTMARLFGILFIF